ncbi:peptidoglycan editing factor PgeF [Utexia brackfieldae]|uniref:peptidoglycan editing factor PgeF n=1 Tax=Utexia brackfieldae TaxID=3074108 RepID=UPI00370D6DCC
MKFIYPDWPAPIQIGALSTMRTGGVSISPYASLNLGSHVGDALVAVMQNRRLLSEYGQLSAEPVWLDQIHSTTVLNLDDFTQTDLIKADASYTAQTTFACTVMTADCLPVLFCSLDGDEVAAAHAGWRGLCHGVLENTLQQFRCSPDKIMAWLGPAIGPDQFEVGAEVKQQFEKVDKHAASAFCLSNQESQKYLADIYLLARQRLNTFGVSRIYGGQHCTVSEPETFFSYRREQITGRMASMIWIK